MENKELQTNIEARYDLIDAKWEQAIAKVLYHGAKKYGEGNWKQLKIEDQINHARAHINAFCRGEKTEEDDLINAACRLMFAWVQSKQ